MGLKFKANRVIESSNVHKELENELEKYDFDIELFMLTSSEADVFKQSEDLSNILNGFLIHAKDKVN